MLRVGAILLLKSVLGSDRNIMEYQCPVNLIIDFDQIRVSSDSSFRMSSGPFNKLNEMPAKSFSDKFDYDNRRGVFWLEKKLAPRRMSFEEAFDKLLAKFQPQREQDWLKELRKNYQVTPN